MIQRCYHPSQNCFARYGGRGVRVCDRWNPKAGGCFENFLADMGEPPSARHTLDKDKLGDGMLYSPETCCWLTPEEQARHTRRTAWVTYNGQEMLLGEAAKLGQVFLFQQSPIVVVVVGLKSDGLSLQRKSLQIQTVELGGHIRAGLDELD